MYMYVFRVVDCFIVMNVDTYYLDQIHFNAIQKLLNFSNSRTAQLHTIKAIFHNTAKFNIPVQPNFVGCFLFLSPSPKCLGKFFGASRTKKKCWRAWSIGVTSPLVAAHRAHHFPLRIVTRLPPLNYDSASSVIHCIHMYMSFRCGYTYCGEYIIQISIHLCVLDIVHSCLYTFLSQFK